MYTGTPPAKSRRAKHNPAQSAPATSTPKSAPPKPIRILQRHDPGADLAPFEDVPRGNSFGSFDANGNYVQEDSFEDNAGPNPPVKGKKKAHKQRAVKNDTYSSAPTVAESGPTQFDSTVPVSASATDSSNDITGTPAKFAYAGPTFHASPAPSALPMPKVFSKSVPTDTNQPSLQTRLDQDSDKSVSPPSVAASPSPAELPKPEPSPLDFIFNAAREEQAKKRSSGGLLTPESNYQQLVRYSEPPGGHGWNNAYHSSQHTHSRQTSNTSGKDVFMLELDGTSRQASPQERMGASRSVTAPSDIPHAAASEEQEVTDKLKQLLANMNVNKTLSLTPPASLRRSPSGYTSDQPNNSPYPSRRSNPRSTSGPTTPINFGPDGNPKHFHYGNQKNLSPLFQAAKSDSVKQSSKLRTEYTGSSPSQGFADVPAFANVRTHPNQRPNSMPFEQATFMRPGGHVPNMRPQHPSSASRSFGAVEAMRSNGRMPPPSGQDHSSPYAPHRYPANDMSQSPNYSTSSLQTFPGAPSGLSPDKQSMEDNLRRMLKLNVLGGSAGVR
ncbi:hypothetical protein K402DRAFT_220443 [Aulographum hederae CBS 113979]|uniref:Uncharacterized protein n=1 Tax=Aulographum hederae CBS 113979 TaxID=1176131 RepID=A0A6G1GM32_9PEZI|nr:hypothetical protein K402DRAFT_220443 [Aulographum hederae CBS 113979]